MSYNAQLNLSLAALRRLLPDVFVIQYGRHLVFEMKSTVTITQGSDKKLVLYTSRKVPDQIGQVGEATLMENLF